MRHVRPKVFASTPTTATSPFSQPPSIVPFISPTYLSALPITLFTSSTHLSSLLHTYVKRDIYWLTCPRNNSETSVITPQIRTISALLVIRYIRLYSCCLCTGTLWAPTLPAHNICHISSFLCFTWTKRTSSCDTNVTSSLHLISSPHRSSHTSTEHFPAPAPHNILYSSTEKLKTHRHKTIYTV